MNSLFLNWIDRNINMEDGFDYKGGDLVCKRCGSKNISIKSGMMIDRAICNSCGNEDYI